MGDSKANLFLFWKMVITSKLNPNSIKQKDQYLASLLMTLSHSPQMRILLMKKKLMNLKSIFSSKIEKLFKYFLIYNVKLAIMEFIFKELSKKDNLMEIFFKKEMIINFLELM